MSKTCICCRIDNAYAELMKHPSESALRSLEQLWKQCAKMASRPEVVLSIVFCKREHSGEGGFTAWADRIIPKLEKLRIERRETRRAHRVKEED
jgi:hypothetical protein